MSGRGTTGRLSCKWHFSIQHVCCRGCTAQSRPSLLPAGPARGMALASGGSGQVRSGCPSNASGVAKSRLPPNGCQRRAKPSVIVQRSLAAMKGGMGAAGEAVQPALLCLIRVGLILKDGMAARDDRDGSCSGLAAWQRASPPSQKFHLHLDVCRRHCVGACNCAIY
jgi:hypothetical protein